MVEQGAANEEKGATASSAGESSNTSVAVLLVILCACAIAAVVELGIMIPYIQNPPAPIEVVDGGSGAAAGAAAPTDGNQLVPGTVPADIGENKCEGLNPKYPNLDCIVDQMANVGPQSGANITKGFKGGMAVDVTPITTPYYQKGLCPVNVHWHLGAEHYSVGEFDENGKGVREIDWTTDGGSATDGMGSFQCHHYDETNPIFTRKYDWQHCIGMEVGQTYEVHWPHSAAGACGTPNQYQSPFYDGVFCNLPKGVEGLKPQDIASNVGVQGQVFTIVNDEQYFRPNLMRGMIVDGELGSDIAIYTGSSTGSSRSNNVCSAYSPVTWQVDRKCHLISASSFDLVCAEMKMQRDDMTYDLSPHGARPLVSKELTADNQQNRNLRKS